MKWRKVGRKAGLKKGDPEVRLRFCDQLLARERELKKATMMSDEKIFALVRPFSTLSDIPH